MEISERKSNEKSKMKKNFLFPGEDPQRLLLGGFSQERNKTVK